MLFKSESFIDQPCLNIRLTEMTSEMVNDAIDDAMDDEEAEDETEDLVNQVN